MSTRHIEHRSALLRPRFAALVAVALLGAAATLGGTWHWLRQASSSGQRRPVTANSVEPRPEPQLANRRSASRVAPTRLEPQRALAEPAPVQPKPAPAPERRDPTQAKVMATLSASGPADPRLAPELGEAIDTWRANLPTELDAQFELDDWSCFAKGCYATARFSDANVYAGISQNLTAQRPASTWSRASTPPVVNADGTVTTLWMSQSRRN